MHFRNKKKSAQDVYISDPIDTDKDGNTLTLQDIMADDGSIFDDIELKLRAERLHCCINELLDSREREILTLRYGLGGAIPLTQREVAQRLGISRSYVSRIEKKAITTLRGRFEKEGGIS
jgi:RNA polymerase sporulation-specific sigma factor